MQRGVLTPPSRCADCFACSWLPCRNNHFYAHFFFFPWRGKCCKCERWNRNVGACCKKSHRPLSEWFSNLFLYRGWKSLENLSPSCGCLCKTKPQTSLKKTTKAEQCTLYFFSLFCFARMLCLLLPPFLTCLGCSVSPSHLLSMALRPSSALSGGEICYPPLLLSSLHTRCLPPSCNPPCSPSKVSAGHLADTAGGGRLEGFVVVPSWHLLLFPSGVQQDQVLGSALPPDEGGCVTPGSIGSSSSSRWLLATSGKAGTLATSPSSPHASPTSREHSAVPSSLWSSLRTTGLIQWSLLQAWDDFCN